MLGISFSCFYVNFSNSDPTPSPTCDLRIKVLPVFPIVPSGSLCPTFTDTYCKDILVVILNLWSHLTYKFILNPDINFNFLRRSDHFSALGTQGTIFSSNTAVLPTRAVPPSNPSGAPLWNVLCRLSHPQVYLLTHYKHLCSSLPNTFKITSSTSALWEPYHPLWITPVFMSVI